MNNSSYEDKLKSIIVKLTNTMLTFDTLPREQAEVAILDTTNKIKEGNSYINKMEIEINTTNENDLIARTPEEINEIIRKINNYKLEFSIIVQKFKIIQDKYINQQTEFADDIATPSRDILIEDEIKNNMKNGNDMGKENKVENNNTPQHHDASDENLQNTQNTVFENNTGNVNGLNQNNIIVDYTFNNFKITIINKKRKFILLLIGIIILIVITVFLFISVRNI